SSGEQSIQLALLAADDGDDRPVHPRDEGNERSEIELTSRANAVGDRLGKGERVPVVVERGREDRNALRPVAFEVVVEPAGDPLEVGFQSGACVVGEVRTVDL